MERRKTEREAKERRKVKEMEWAAIIGKQRGGKNEQYS